jgi:hypothetical protein
MQYPLAHLIIRPAKPYTPASHQTVDTLKATLQTARRAHPHPQVVRVVAAR